MKSIPRGRGAGRNIFRIAILTALLVTFVPLAYVAYMLSDVLEPPTLTRQLETELRSPDGERCAQVFLVIWQGFIVTITSEELVVSKNGQANRAESLLMVGAGIRKIRWLDDTTIEATVPNNAATEPGARLIKGVNLVLKFDSAMPGK